MPAWVWVLLGLTALGFVVWLLENTMEQDVTERFGKVLTILVVLAVLVAIVLSFSNGD